MKNITVYCGSSAGFDPEFREIAFELGTFMADRQIGLVYGGAKIGLMGAVADGVLAGKGSVTGVIPGFLKTVEVVHEGLTALIVVENMHERKLKMHELCDGVITLPGGFGTMEEYFEVLTWGQLGLHSKPTGLLNCKGFYDPLLELATTMVKSGFLKQQNRDLMLVAAEIPVLVNMMENYMAPVVKKWL